MLQRFGWALTGAIALLAVLALARAMEAGPLDPPGPVGSTMRTLDEVLPSWDRKLSAVSADPCNSQRFQCVFPDATYADGAAVLDRETGLVWQRVPAVTGSDWANAVLGCEQLALGGRWGWRLPAVEELTSLLLSDSPGPFDPGLFPLFWSSTRNASAPSNYLLVDFTGQGTVYQGLPSDNYHHWCVRGGTAQPQ